MEMGSEAPYIRKEREATDRADGVERSRDPWADRATGLVCARCAWYVPKARSGPQPGYPQVEIGRCRRHAPTMAGYPVVYTNDWCGDFRPDENKA